MLTAECVKTYVLQVDDVGNIVGETSRQRSYTAEEVHDAGVEVDRRAKSYMATTGTSNYTLAVHKILDDDPGLMAAYS